MDISALLQMPNTIICFGILIPHVVVCWDPFLRVYTVGVTIYTFPAAQIQAYFNLC